MRDFPPTPVAALVLSLGRRKRVPEGLVAVQLESDGFAFAHVTRAEQEGPLLRRCEFVRAAPGSERKAALADLVQREQLNGARAVFVLGPSDYAQRTVDAGNVPEHEQRAAARWAVKDLIDFDVEDAAVDVFQAPGDEPHRDAGRVHVAVARAKVVQEIVQLARETGLDPVAIDIMELAVRNLAALHPLEASGIGVLTFRGEAGLITVNRGGLMYLARWVDAAGVEEIKGADGELVADGNPELETLLLELQRSLDYYEHELRQRPATALALAPVSPEMPALREYLERNLGVRIESLDLSRVMGPGCRVDVHTQFRCLAAIGGALREETCQA